MPTEAEKVTLEVAKWITDDDLASLKYYENDELGSRLYEQIKKPIDYMIMLKRRQKLDDFKYLKEVLETIQNSTAVEIINKYEREKASGGFDVDEKELEQAYSQSKEKQIKHEEEERNILSQIEKLMKKLMSHSGKQFIVVCGQEPLSTAIKSHRDTVEFRASSSHLHSQQPIDFSTSSSFTTISPQTDYKLRKVVEWSAYDVGEWLTEIGFARYKTLFSETHRIDGETLLLLSEDDLRKPPFSLQALGDIKKLIIPIERLQQEEHSSMPALKRAKTIINLVIYHAFQHIFM